MGYSNGDSVNTLDWPGSRVPGSFLDSNPNGLTSRATSASPAAYVISGPTIVGAPVVTIDDTNPARFTPDQTSTISFKATTDGTYSTRHGGTNCSTGSELDSGYVRRARATARRR